MRPVLLALVLAGLVPSGSAEGANYRLRYSHAQSGDCDFRYGWVVDPVGDRLFAGGVWDESDCGRYGYGLLVHDLATGAVQQSLPGTYGAVAAGDRLLLGHVDGIELVNATTSAVRTFDPALLLRGTVGGDLLAVGPGDAPATAAQYVGYR